jgi:outer membrane lipoprotein-sorting protein
MIRAWLLSALLFACPAGAFAAPAQATQTALAELKARTDRLVSLRGEFIQETDIPMFSAPMRSRGRLLFRRPDALRWEYLEPMREGFVLVGAAGFRWEKDVRYAFTPGGDPVARLIAGQLTAWLAFDRARIERDYRIEALSLEPIRLKMTPLSETAGSVVASITIVFTPEGVASSVRIDESKGGSTTISFTDTLVNQPLDDKEFQ